MFKIGLTGMSGSGKSYISDIFRLRGFAVINTDKVYHEIISKPGECVDEIASQFGDSVINIDGSIDRKALSQIVYNSREAMDNLNKITHKFVDRETDRILKSLDREEFDEVIIDVPLMFESGFDGKCDIVVGVIAPYELCIERIVDRDGIDVSTAEKRLASQHNADYFREHCDYIINNDGSPLENQIEKLYAIIKEKKHG